MELTPHPQGNGKPGDVAESEREKFEAWWRGSKYCQVLGTPGRDWRQIALDGYRAGLADMEARKDAAYEERNKVVAALAKVFPSGIARTAIEGWSEDWHGCVYIDLPTGQVSWHFHDSQAHLFDGLPPYSKPWDGHDTEEKYRRVAALAATPQPAIPPGFKVVPVKATREMLNAAVDVDSFKLGDISPIGFRISPQQLFERCYAAMLSAAPVPEAGQGVSDEQIIDIWQAGGPDVMQWVAGRADVLNFVQRLDRARALLSPAPAQAQAPVEVSMEQALAEARENVRRWKARVIVIEQAMAGFPASPPPQSAQLIEPETVPREPTAAMVDAGLSCHDNSAAPEDDLAAAWRAMWDVANGAKESNRA